MALGPETWAASSRACARSTRGSNYQKCRCTAASLEIIDNIKGNFSSAVSRHYLHPKIQSYNRKVSDKKIILKNLIIESYSHDLSVVDTNWYPEFGVSIPNKCINMSKKLDNSAPKFQLKFLKN